MYVCNIRNLPSSFIFVGDDGSAAGASAGATIDLVFFEPSLLVFVCASLLRFSFTH